jgi:GntR family transcriptional regulator/MocR family aminotransferase
MTSISRSSVLALVHLDRDARIPVRQQLYARIRELILRGHLAADVQLPSSRTLVAELGVSRNTVVAAFDQLIAEGYLEAKVGAGSFVASTLPDALGKSVRAAPQIVRSSRARRELSRTGETLTRRDATLPLPIRPRAFALGIPSVDEFPHAAWARIVAKRCGRSGASLSAYGAPGGLRALREVVSDYLVTARGVRCTPAQVFIVGGSQQGLNLAVRILLDRGDSAWLENPGYHGAREALDAAGARITPVPVDSDGLDVSAGEAIEAHPRFVYVTPSHQFPLGTTMTMRRRAQLLALASKVDAWVFEDDYDSEFRYAGRPLPALQGLDDENRVIYAGTFSKGLLPSLRLGYLVVPTDLVDAFQRAHSVAGLHGSMLDQAVVADFIREGHFARHIRRMRRLYATRRELLIESLHRHLGSLIDVALPSSGTHVVVHLPAGMSDVDACRAAAANGVVTTPLSSAYIGAAPPGLLLGYASVRGPLIERGVRQLASALQSLDPAPRVGTVDRRVAG